MKNRPQEVRLVEAAQLLKLPYTVTLNLVLRGKLTGRQNDGRHWYVTIESVTRYIAELNP